MTSSRLARLRNPRASPVGGILAGAKASSDKESTCNHFLSRCSAGSVVATTRPALQLASGQAAWGCFYNYPTNAVLLLFASSFVPMMGS